MTPGAASRTTGRWAWLWEAPALPLAEAAADGEYLLARLRLVLICSLSINGIALVLQRGFDRSLVVSAVVQWLALLHAGLIAAVARRRSGRAWIGFVSSAGDGALVTLCLFVFGWTGLLSAALSHAGVFPLYYLVIASTALRYDTRICVVTTASIVLEYALFLAWSYPRVLSGTVPLYAAATPEWRVVHFSSALESGNFVVMAATGILAAILVARAQHLCTLSTRDPLTGLLNRRFFDERLAEESERARRGRSRFAVALIDVDRFKHANDLGGHRAGDFVLRRLAEVLARSFRATDTVARYGGDEFAVLLPEAGDQDLQARFEAAIAAVEAIRVRVRGNLPPPRIGLSIGVAIAPGEADSAAGLIEIADRRLYVAKAAGGGRVVGPECDASATLPKEHAAGA